MSSHGLSLNLLTKLGSGCWYTALNLKGKNIIDNMLFCIALSCVF